MIDFNKYNSKKVGILGLGITGESIFKSIKDSNAEIYLWDDNFTIREKYSNNKEKLTRLEDWPWDNLDYFFPSPGVDLKNKIFLNKLNKNKTRLMSDISLFEAERGSTFPSGTMIAITGTNGKSSTATILYDILKKEGFDVRLAGNIGIPILSLEPGNENTVYIIEISSFQIELTENIKPEIAVLLNISEDHLDRHSSIEEYREIKSRIFLNQMPDDFSIIYNNNEHTDFISKKSFVSKKIILSEAESLDKKKYYSKNLIPIKEVLKILKIPYFIPDNYFKNFKGLNHRLELICESNGVKFINDSKATNPSATNMAFDLIQNIFWIGGGESKGNDLSKINFFSKNLKKVFLVGSSSKELFNLTPKIKNPLIFKNLDSALRAAYIEAKKSGGGNILLSPGCSSHDQFKNFEERGDIFSEIALSLIGLEKRC